MSEKISLDSSDQRAIHQRDDECQSFITIWCKQVL